MRNKKYLIDLHHLNIITQSNNKYFYNLNEKE